MAFGGDALSAAFTGFTHLPYTLLGSVPDLLNTAGNAILPGDPLYAGYRQNLIDQAVDLGVARPAPTDPRLQLPYLFGELPADLMLGGSRTLIDKGSDLTKLALPNLSQPSASTLLTRQRGSIGEKMPAVHYGKDPHRVLETARQGTAGAGAEASRYAGERNAPPSIHYYRSDFPFTKEAHLGNAEHAVTLENVLDLSSAEGQALARGVRAEEMRKAQARSSGRFAVHLDPRETADAIERAAFKHGYKGIARNTPTGTVIKYYDDVEVDQPLALPNPGRARAVNELQRQESWTALETASRGAGVKRGKIKGGEELPGPALPGDKPLVTPVTGGQYVGAPAGINTPAKRNRLVTQYDERTQRALDQGLEPGYFYDKGRKTLGALTDTPEDHYRTSRVFGPTSTQVGPQANLDYTARVLDQEAMGVPSSATLYPHKSRRDIDAALRGDEAWQGYKLERYGGLLSPQEYTRRHQLATMPPNDRWEWFGVGGPRGQVPSGPTQVAFTDDIRARAARRMNKRRAEQGRQPLTLEEMQELHWAAIRHETNLADEIIKDMNQGRKVPLTIETAYRSPAFRKRLEQDLQAKPLKLAPGDTIQGAVPGQTLQHNWEAMPGPNSGATIGDMSPQQYTDEAFNVFQNEQGKDRLVSSMGGRLQLPMTRGPGVYMGEVNPGVQSRSLVSHTQQRGLEPASAKRADVTEAVRQYALAQDARSASAVVGNPNVPRQDVIVTDLGRQLTDDQARVIDSLLAKEFGEGKVAVVSTGNGYNILNPPGTMPNKRFREGLEKITHEIDAVTGKPVERGAGQHAGIYDEFDWQPDLDVGPQEPVTRALLKVIDDADFPGAAARADSPETRKLIGDIASMYDRLESLGVMPPPKLKAVLKAWATEGLPKVRRMVQQGLAPAVVLGVLAGQNETQPTPAM
ncbi:hypothetical protein K0U83_16665 [bacterium]|nr:hypothetical protein [bacterium]